MAKKPNFKEIYPHIWNQYVFYYNEIRRYEHKFEFLLALSTLLLIVFLQLLDKIIEWSSIFYFPLFLFMIVIGILFYHSIIRKIWLPFFTKEKLKEEIYDKNKDFYETVVRDIYGVLPHLKGYKKDKMKIFHISINILLLASFSIVGLVLIGKGGYCYSIFLGILMIIVFFWVNKLWNKEYLSYNPSYEVEKFFDDWLKKFQK